MQSGCQPPDRPAVCQTVCGDQHLFALPVPELVILPAVIVRSPLVSSELRYSSAQVEGMPYPYGRQASRGYPGERATVGDTVLTNRDMLPWTVPRLSSEFPSRESVPAKADCPGCPWWLRSAWCHPGHDIAGTGQLTGCRSSKVTGCSTEPLFAQLSACTVRFCPCGSLRYAVFYPGGRGRPPSASSVTAL